MPLYETRHIDNCSILAVWRVEEDVEELYRQVYLSEKDEEYFNTISNENRRKEWLATRLLTQMMLEEEVSILYEDTGKPYIFNSDWNISITHKNEFVGIILGKGRYVAIDIEELSTRIDKVYDFFMSEKELASLHKNHRNFQLHLHWCAKECLIKIANRKDLKPVEEMYVHPIHPLIRTFKAEVMGDKANFSFSFSYEKLSENYVVVWTSDTVK